MRKISFAFFFNFGKKILQQQLLFLFLLLFLFSCKKTNLNGKLESNLFYDEAFIFLKGNKQDSAYIKFNKAKEIFLEKKDSLHVAKCLINMAIIEADKGDYFGSQETSLSAIKFLNERKKENFEDISSNYNCLGIANQNLRNYKEAISFYNKSLNFSVDSITKLISQNNKALVYQNLEQYQKSIKIYTEIISHPNSKNDPKNYARLLDNLEYTKFLQDHNYHAEENLLKALKLRDSINDISGKIASHSHLADFYLNKEKNKSQFHLKQKIFFAEKINNPDDQIEALQKLILLENLENSRKYFSTYQKLNDSLQTARAKAKNQFALIRYDTEKEKAENAQNKVKILNRNIALLLSFLAIIVGALWYKKRKKRVEQEKEILKQEKEIEVKNTQLKYSKKVHDVVANGLYQTMVEIENRPELDKEKVLNHIEKLYEESRDIAQDDFVEIPEKEFSGRLYQMINSYNSDNQRIYIAGNDPKIWENISANTQSELYYVIRELLVNMKKHSHAKLVSLKFEKKQKNLKIKYIDNGIGISDLEIKKGSGIKNTENRIATIGGEINFEKNPKGGLLINISIPTL